MPDQTNRGTPRRKYLLSSTSQSIGGFVIPTIILLLLSNESRLGPIRAMLLALMPPLLLELYSFRVRRKPSLISILAILGILFIGAISIFGLSEEWLAIRRSAIFFIAAIGIVILLKFKRNIVEKVLARIINMDIVHKAAKDKGTIVQVSKHIDRTLYVLAALLGIIGIVSYIMTIAFITAPMGTSDFNTQYAQLRLLSLIVITLPLLTGATGLLIYLVSGLEKLTGIETDMLLKKKK